MPAKRYLITISSKNTEVFRSEYEFDHDDPEARDKVMADALSRSGYGAAHGPHDDITTNIVAIPD